MWGIYEESKQRPGEWVRIHATNVKSDIDLLVKQKPGLRVCPPMQSGYIDASDWLAGIRKSYWEKLVVTEQHIALATRFSIKRTKPGEYANETIAEVPCISFYRPYGNSDAEGDIAEIMGIEREESGGFSAKNLQRIAQMHREAMTTLGILVSNNGVQPGTYVKTLENGWQLRNGRKLTQICMYGLELAALPEGMEMSESEVCVITVSEMGKTNRQLAVFPSTRGEYFLGALINYGKEGELDIDSGGLEYWDQVIQEAYGFKYGTPSKKKSRILFFETITFID